MVKPCFIWKHKRAYHIMDVPGNCYGVGATVEDAIASAVRKGIAECEIDTEGVSVL